MHKYTGASEQETNYLDVIVILLIEPLAHWLRLPFVALYSLSKDI